MKKRNLLCTTVVCLTINLTLIAQDPVSLDVLKAPSSASSVILGVSPTEVERPTDVTGLMLSLRNATNEFTAIPSSFAIDIAPKWFFDKKHISFDDFLSNKFKQTFSQSFTVSLAHVSQDDKYYRGLKHAFGIKFSLIRGKIIDQHFFDNVKGITKLLVEKNQRIIAYEAEIKGQDPYKKKYADLEASKLRTSDGDTLLIIINELELLDNTVLNLAKQKFAEEYAAKNVALKKLEATITPVRKGAFLDFAAGTLLKYDDFVFNRSSLTNSSAWLNAGYEGLNTDDKGNSYFSVLGMTRFIHDNADELYKKGIPGRVSTWDYAFRIAFTTLGQKLSVAAEIVGRNFISSTKDNLSKYLVNVEYKIGKNKKLTFSYGKDFSNNITKEGNVLGLLNFITGFMDNKKIDGL